MVVVYMEDPKEVYKDAIDQANPDLVAIHKYVTIGRGSRILTHCPYRAYGSNPFISIRDFVWIGWNCTIQMGVTLSHGCFIGAGSVVTRDCDEFTINVGNPCRFLRMRSGIEMIRTFCAGRMGDTSGLVPDFKAKWRLLTNQDIQWLFKLPRERINDDDPIIPLEEYLVKKHGLRTGAIPNYDRFSVDDVLNAYEVVTTNPKGKKKG